ncbi:MAG: protein CpxP [Alteromonas macleodii]|jgi:protein CpxP
MTKTRILTILVVVMVLLNAATLVFFLNGNRHGPRPHGRHEVGPKNIVIEKLSFNTEQIAKYEQLITEHRVAINRNDSLMLAVRNGLYKQLVKQDSTEIELQLYTIGKLQKEVEIVHFQHFQDLRAICTEEQLPAFEELIEELAAFFNGGRPPQGKQPPPPRH